MRMKMTLHPDPITPEPGVYFDVPWQEYVRWDAFSKSLVDPALRSARHLRRAQMERKKSAALQFGSLVDCLLLDPGEYADRYIEQPATYQKIEASGRGANRVEELVEKPWDLRSNTCREIKAQLEATGKTVVTADMKERAENCAVAAQEHPEAADAIKNGQKQVSIVWLHESGVLCKGRFDILHDGYIWDLKTTQDASPEAFAATVAKFGYHVQGGIYTEAYEKIMGKKLDWRFIAVESTDDEPWPEVAVYEMLWDDRSLIVGRMKFKRACERVARYSEEMLSGYSPYAEPISIPEWAIWQEVNKHEGEVEL